MGNKPAVWIPFANINFATGAATPQYLNTGGVSDAVVDAQFGGLVKSTYSMIVRAIMVDGGMAMKDTVLTNGGTLADSLAYAINQYCFSFLQLRGLQGCLGAGNVNYTMSLIANAVNQNIFALEGALRRLMTYAVPPKLVRYLDRMCGPIMWSEDDPIIIAGVGSATSDFTTSAAISSIITGAVQSLANLTTGNGAGGQNDAQAIWNTFAIAYGSPDIPVSKEVQFDPMAYCMQLFQCGSYRNDTTTLTYTWPNVNGDTVIPLMIPRGASGECLEQAFTLLRPSVYSPDAVAGFNTAAALPCQVGLVSNVPANGVGTSGGYYPQSGAVAQVVNHQAGTKVFPFTDSSLELVPWIPLSGLTTTTNYQADARIFQSIDRVYVTRDMMIEETNFAWEQMWLEPLRQARSVRSTMPSRA